MRHKHADLIHQLAEGAVGQYYLASNRTWVDFEPSQYGIVRIKPGTENSGLPPGAIFVVDNPIAAAPKPQRKKLTVREQFAMAANEFDLAVYAEIIRGEMEVGVLPDGWRIRARYMYADAMIEASGVSDE